MGFLAGRCVIPIRNEQGRLVAYAGRAVDGQEPKYRFPAGFRKSQVLFNLDRAIETGDNNAIVVEGFFDALKVHQAGHPAVVALMGSSFSQRQSELLLSRFASVTAGAVALPRNVACAMRSSCSRIAWSISARR